MKHSVCLLAMWMVASSAWGAQNDTQPAMAPPAGQTVAPAIEADASTVLANADCGCVPAGTAIELEIDQPLSSAIQKRGDKFAIKLHAPIARDGVVLIPAGTAGVGEIVHADHSRGGGKPGELLIAARYLDFEGAQVPLHALKFGGQGKDNTKVAIGTAIAIGVFAQFIHGREIEIPAGTVVNAKLAQDLAMRAATAPENSPKAHSAASSTTAPSASTHKE